MIKAGDPIPSVTIKQATAEGPQDVDPAALFAGKHVVMFAVPGAFTPTCSTQHLPGYVARLDEFAARGVDLVACLAVNDAWVMQAWAAQHGALGKIVMLADGTAAFTPGVSIHLNTQVGSHGGDQAIFDRRCAFFVRPDGLTSRGLVLGGRVLDLALWRYAGHKRFPLLI